MTNEIMPKTCFFPKGKAFLIIQLLIFIIFCTVVLGLVFSNGICCGDDAYYAIIAKNLANGLGYTSTIQDSHSDFQIKVFDPRIGVGPTIIFPASLIIKIFGNTYWAPGLSIVIIWMICLYFIWRKLNKLVPNKLELTISIGTFFILSYLFTAYHFEQWYALLGEIPAAFLVMLGILEYFDSSSKAHWILTGFIFFLASQAKPITLLPFAIFLSFLFLKAIFSTKEYRHQAIRTYFKSVFYITIGFMIPFLMFEGWKLLTLNWSGYTLYYKEVFLWGTEKGTGGIDISTSRLIDRIKILTDRFGIYLPAVIALLIGVGVFIRKEKKLSAIFYSISSVIFIFSFYWIFISIGWARYFFIGLIFIIFLLILPFWSVRLGWKLKLIYTLILAIFAIIACNKINVKYPLQNVKLFFPTQYTSSVNEMVGTLSGRIDEQPFVTEWWGTAADMEYLLPGYYNFRTYKDPNFDFSKAYIVVANRKFILLDDKDFMSFIEHCEIRDNTQFMYGDCDQIFYSTGEE